MVFEAGVRRARLLSLPAWTVAQGVRVRATRLAGRDVEPLRAELRRRNAERTRRMLGELKGGALKAGQLLSAVDALLPQDPDATWSEALGSLREDARPELFGVVERVLVAELGADWRRHFTSLDETPAAAASIGQVHRARWRDGRDVAVKIQYPGVAEAITSDVRFVTAATRVAALVAPTLALPPLVGELRTRLAEELDYLREARVQQAFAAAYRNDPHAVVPDVVAVTRRVLVTDWLDGTPLVRYAEHAGRTGRDAIAQRYQQFLVSGPERAGWLHTDPHPGNFRVTGDGRLGVVDFGSALEMPGGIPPTFGKLLAALSADDAREIASRLRDAGFVRPGADLDVDKLLGYMRPFSDPARHETFTFTRDWLRGQFGRLGDPRNPDFAVALQLRLPPEHLFTQRVWLGMVGVLCQLDATVPVGDVLRRWLPGFSDDAPAAATEPASPPSG